MAGGRIICFREFHSLRDGFLCHGKGGGKEEEQEEEEEETVSVHNYPGDRCKKIRKSGILFKRGLCFQRYSFIPLQATR